MNWDVARTELLPFLDSSITFTEEAWEDVKDVVFGELSSWMELGLSDKFETGVGGPKLK
tara:strand:+ start:353 stop:529 length:177 start_codon:yes stop_codon:yes gene_type:complete